MSYDIEVGILKQQNESSLSVPQMRALIYEAGYRGSSLVRNCINLSRKQGLTGEDTMTLIAYHALRLLQDTSEIIQKQASLTPIPNRIFKPGPAELPPEKS